MRRAKGCCRLAWAVVACLVVQTTLLAVPAHAAPDGALDPGFDGDGRVTTDFGSNYDAARAVAVQADGRIVVAGARLQPGTTSFDFDFALARYNPDGSLDTSFDGDGRVTTGLGASESANAVAIQADGRIVVAGYRLQSSATVYNLDFALARYNPDGSLDTSFDGDGKVITGFEGSGSANAVALQADGMIVAAGQAGAHFGLARYTPNGALDTGFDGDGRVTTEFVADHFESADALAIQDDGRLVAGGYTNADRLHPRRDIALARYNADGSLDSGFDGDGRVITDLGRSDAANAVVIQPDGKIVAGGSSGFETDILDSVRLDFAVVRYHTDGSLDSGFDGDGKVITDFDEVDIAHALVMQADGRIVAAGAPPSYAAEPSQDFFLARYNPDGSLDSGFDGDGKLTTDFGGTDSALAVALQADGKIVAAGTTVTSSGGDDIALARYHSATRAETASQAALSAGGTLTTDNEADGATAADPLETTVKTPAGGEVTIMESRSTAPAPSSLSQLDLQSAVTAPSGTATDPLRVTFAIDASELPTGLDVNRITVLKGGAAVPGCTGPAGTANPDPCIGSRATLTGGDAEIVVLTSTAGSFNFATPSPGRFHTVPFARILDTRSGVGQGGSTEPVGQAAHITLNVTGRGGVPATGVAAVVMNLTSTESTAPSYLTVHPASEPRPTASSLNLEPAQDVANLVTAKLDGAGNVRIYNNAGSTHVVADVMGWYGTGAETEDGSRFTALAPSRVLDTRDGTGQAGRKAPVENGRDITVEVAGAGGVPGSGVSAVVMNFTATEGEVQSYLTVYPADQVRLAASNINVRPGRDVPNLAIVPLSASGRVNVYNNARSTHVVADVVGYFGSPGAAAGAVFTPLSPDRVLDTRDGTGQGALPARVEQATSITLDVTGARGVPESGVSGVVVNLTATGGTASSFVTMFPAGQSRPLASNLNLVPDQDVANLVTVKVGSDGNVRLYNNAGAVHLVADVVGYYAG